MTKKVLLTPKPLSFDQRQKSADLDEAIGGISWSPNGERILVWTRSGNLICLDEDLNVKSSWKAHQNEILRSSWSCDSTLIASSGREGQCKIWTPDGLCLASLEHQEGWVEHVKWSPWLKILITGCSNRLSVWSQSGALVDEFVGHKWPITDVDWHPTQRELLASCAADGVRAWRLGDSEPMHRLNSKEYPERLRFNRAGSILAYGCSDSSIHVWTMESGIVLKLAGRTGGLQALEWSWGGQWLAFCGDYEAYLWRFNQHAPQSSLPGKLVGSFGRLRSMRFHDYEHLLACGDEEGSVYIWRTDKADRIVPIAMCPSNLPVQQLAWSPLSRQLLIAHTSGRLVLWTSDFKSITAG